MPDRKDAVSRLFSRLFGHRRQPATRRKLTVESLEWRRVLAVSGMAPAITGTVYFDTDQDGNPSPGEGVEDVTINLFVDDGNGVLDGSDIQLLPDAVTDANGVYCFDNLNGTLGFFVVQPAQTTPGGVTLNRQESGLIQPGAPTLPIDLFETSQSVRAIPPAPSSDGSTLQFADETEVIGAERDMFVEMTAGLGEVELRVNPFGVLPVLQYDATSGVEGRSILTWDGIDNDASPTPSLGLNGRDLTQNGDNTGLTTQLGIDPSGAGEMITFTLFQGSTSNTSVASAPIPVTDGTAIGYLFIPFSDFTGTVSVSDVDAIQMSLGAGVPSADAQVLFVGATGPQQQDFFNANATTTDLAISKTDGSPTSVPGEAITYTITVDNFGPVDVVGASVEDIFPTELVGVTYSSTTTGTVSGNTASGSGDIMDTVDMTVGSQIVYTVTATIDPSARGTLSNTATVSVPPAMTDSDSSNNLGLDRNPLEPEVNLEIIKDDGLTDVASGAQTTYTMIVTNPGPSDVVDAVIEDLFPAELTGISFTSDVLSGTVSGNTASGTGDINDMVSMSAGSSLRYTAVATVSANSGVISNTATVTAPVDTLERDPSDNTSTDMTAITNEVDLSIDKTDGSPSSVPGDDVVYMITVQNLGPIDVVGASVEDFFPAELQNVSYTSTTTGTASGNTASGTGDIQDDVDMAVGSTITYTVTGTVDPSATGQLVNVARVLAPDDATDSDPGNNVSTDTNDLTPVADLAITKDDGETTAAPGQVLTYTIVVSNPGPSDVVAATVTDNFPGELTGVTYTSTAQGGASGNSPSGSGNILDSVDLPAGSSITYTASGTVADSSTIDVINTADVTSPANVSDPDPSNNSATDLNSLIPGVDLEITKTSDPNSVAPGSQIEYVIVVTNNGPNPVFDASVADVFPSELTNVSYTSTASGTASGNTPSGTGNIDDSLDMSLGGSVTYNVMATVAGDASGTILNTATVTAPNTVTELDPTNNSDTDTATIVDQLLASISGFVYLDLNDDGVMDPGEPPIADAEIILLDADRVELQRTTTDDAGAWSFDALLPGDYFVRGIQPDDFRDGIDSVGGDIGEVIESDLFFVPLEDGDNATGLNFGELPLQPSKRSLLASRFRDLADDET